MEQRDAGASQAQLQLWLFGSRTDSNLLTLLQLWCFLLWLV